MSLNPEDRKNWQGFIEFLQPPPGYRLAAALGTTFGLSLEVLVAALLSMCDADGEELGANPVAATMAITRMASKVRVLVHPATVSAPLNNAGTNRFVAMLDRLIVEVQPQRGLFHPKVWAVRFEHVGVARRGEPTEIGRVLVGSRNLTRSTSFELAAAFEGTVAPQEGVASEFGSDVARALREWMTATSVRFPQALWALPQFVRRLEFDVSHDATEVLRLRWQGGTQRPLVNALPSRLQRAVLVSPFIQPDFVKDLLGRSETLQVVSVPESLDALPDDTFAALQARATSQGSPVLYQVTQHGSPDDAFIDGIHAKLLLTEGPRQQQATFVGSANATGPGWGIGATANVEAVIEMKPGIGIDRFVSGFIRESKTKIHPWVSEYDRSVKPEPDLVEEAQRHLLAALREVAKIQLTLAYDSVRKRLTLSSTAAASGLASWITGGGAEFSLVPLLLEGMPGAWRSLSVLETGECHFDDVPLGKVSAFVALRGQMKAPSLECRRFVVARLEANDALWDERDENIRADILATADPAMILNALVRGLAHVRSESAAERSKGSKGNGLSELLAETTLERLLQAVALDPALVSEMRLLLGPVYGEPLLKLCDDLDEVLRDASAEATS